MKILLFGKNGQVFCGLNRTLLLQKEIIAQGWGEADLSRPECLRALLWENITGMIIEEYLLPDPRPDNSQMDLSTLTARFKVTQTNGMMQ